METLCKIRNLYRAIMEYEVAFQKQYNLGLNEGMLLCSLSHTECMASGEIAHLLGLSLSNTSKVIKSAEQKGYLSRTLGRADKRQMFFSLTSTGRQRLAEIKCRTLTLPPELQKVV
ncbi:MAG: MarR family transcriptional regulator [Alistipes sp.]